MQHLTTRPIWVLILAVVLLFVALAAVAAVVYMLAFLGLLSTPLQALPPLFWMLLLITVMVGLVCLIIGVSSARTRRVASSETSQYPVFKRVHIAVPLGFGGVLFLQAFVNNLIKPQQGGYTALLLTAACKNLMAGYALHKMSQVAK